MALMVANPGQYILGGLSAPSRGISEEFQAGLQANLGRQDARQVMRAREQTMGIAASQEARAQQQFEFQQQQARAAAAQAAARQRALAALTTGLGSVGAAPTPSTPGAAPIAPVAPPQAGLAVPPTMGGAPLSFGDLSSTAVSPRMDGGVPLAYPSAPAKRTFAQAPVSGGAGTPVLPGGSGADTLTAAPARGAQDLAPRLPAEIAGLSREEFAQLPIQDQLDIIQFQDATAGMRARGAEAYTPYNYQPTGQGFFVETFAPGSAAEIRARNATMREAGETAPPASVAQPRPDDILPEGTPEPISDAAATAEAATTAEEAAPTQRHPWGGLQLSFGTPVELAFSTNNGRGSEAYVAAPENIYRDAEVIDRQRQRLTLLAQFYQQTGDAEQLIGVMNQLDELSIEQRYLDGMLAVVGIQQADFGAVQTLLQERYRGQEVEVRPYTDGTVEIFLNGQSEARITWDQLATSLRSVYDRGYIEQQQALAAEAQERSRITFEAFTKEEAQAAREVTTYESRQELDRALAEGELRQVSTEPPVYNMTIGGRLVPVTVEAVTSGRPPTTQFVIRRIDTSAVD